METLVLVLTDVQGSTRLWQDEAAAMDAAMRRHHAIVHGAVELHGGWRPVDQGEGDAVFAAFRSPREALAAAATVQRRLHAEPWPTCVPLRVRIGVHVGEVIARDGNLFGDAVNRCARLRGLGAGGQTLLSAAVHELVQDRLPEGASVSYLGEHRMKDLTRPERVWQLDLAGLPSDFPPLASLDRVTHNLPVQLTPFIGRVSELAGVVAAVRAHRLVTLTGFGGMGKTRIALQAAAELAGDAAVGEVWFVDLTSVTDASLVAGRIAEAIGLQVGAADPVDALVERFRATTGLLVLDNLEQVISCAPTVDALLTRASGLRVLGTSREALRLRSEIQVPVEPMQLPSAADAQSEKRLDEIESVRLFVDRACAVLPDFVITSATAPAVAEICRRLDGHPLALELAASRVKVLGVHQLLERLDSALTVLVAGVRDMPARHQTLRATIAWSYDALEEPEKQLLGRMSVLPSDAHLEMIEAVCGDGLDVLSSLEALVERSLVQVVPRAAARRFGLLGSVQAFAHERVGSHAAAVVRERHVDYIAQVLSSLQGADEASYRALHAEVRAELTHVRAALALLAGGSELRHAQLVADLQDTLIHKGLLGEMLGLALRGLEAARDLAPADADLQTRLITQAYFAEVNLGRSSPGRAAEVRDVARRAASPHVRALALALCVPRASSHGEVISLLDEVDAALALLPAHDPALEDERNNVAALALTYVDPEASMAAARAMTTEAKTIAQALSLARVHLGRGEGALALAAVDDVSSRQLTGEENPAFEMLISVTRARGLALLDRDDEATSLLDSALRDAQVVGLRIDLLCLAAAEVDRRAGRHDQALVALDRAARASASPGLIEWRRLVCRSRLGVDVSEAALADVRSLLAADQLYGRLELLGVLAERAVRIVEEGPERAAQVVGCIAAHRGRWVLPFSMDRDVQLLEARLLPTHAAAYEAGRELDPTEAW